jgi:hypothetical protein
MHSGNLHLTAHIKRSFIALLMTVQSISKSPHHERNDQVWIFFHAEGEFARRA